MKKILMSLILLLTISFAANATVVLPYFEVDFDDFEVTSKAEEVEDAEAVLIYCAISYSSDTAVPLMNQGYYNVQLEGGYWGVWVMILNDGEWFSANYVYNPSNKYIGCYVTKYKYIGETTNE